MIEGTILNFKNNNGQIKGDDGKTYDFNRKAIAQGAVNDVRRGRRVRLQSDGNRARDVVLLDQVVEVAMQQPKPATSPSPMSLPASAVRPEAQTATAFQGKPAPRSATGKPYRFLNPYNFVRPLEADNHNVEPLVGRCAPPPHDRFVGLTGRIKCQLTATTPIFVSDSEGISGEQVSGKTHLHYRFFHDPEGNVAIPGTSLRGAVRSIFEAVTNSCFANFAGDKHLSYHLPPGDALKLVPARVRKASDDRWELDLLPGTTTVNPNQRPSGPQYAAWVHAYTPLWSSRTGAKAPTTPYAKREKVSLQGFEHGERCQAIVELVQHPLRRFEFWNVVHLVKEGQSLPKPKGNQREVSGYLCINNQNIENKHDERLFFTAQPSSPIELPNDVRQKYAELISDYQERHGDEAGKRKQPMLRQGKEPAFSRFILDRTRKDDAKLRDGDLVYAMLERASGVLSVQFIVPVSVPRVGFNHAIGELLFPDELKKCTQYDHLCPACRTFGWVWGGEERGQAAPDLTERTAYAGRVRFNHAMLTHDAGTFDSTLAILSTPKPTTARFYLRPQRGKPQDGLPDHQVDYDATGQTLRGRKIYRHHGGRLSPQEYQSVNGAKSDQNRSVHGVQNAGSVFEFTIDFENLARMELGALLWSLRLEGWHHRIGYAKPLGFGSAQIEILGVSLVNFETRYVSLFDRSDGWIDQTSQLETWVSTFKEAMTARYGASFENLENIRDLKALLSETPPLAVHYPRPTRQPQPEGKQYEWFVGNKRSGQDAGPRLALRLADEDREGLPLIDKYGDQGG